MASESASKPANFGQSNSTPKKRAPSKASRPQLAPNSALPPRHIRRQQERAQMKGNPLVSESEVQGEVDVPNVQVPPQVAQAGADIAKLIGNIFNRKPQYTSVIKSLEEIGIEPNIMPVMVPESSDPVECLVIPLQDLVFKEWQIMGGSSYEITKK